MTQGFCDAKPKKAKAPKHTEPCPFCGAGSAMDSMVAFECRTFRVEADRYVRSIQCYETQIGALKAEIKKLQNTLDNTVSVVNTSDK